MHLVKTTGTTAASQKLAYLIQAELSQGKKVVWLISGGSAITIAVEAQKLLTNTENLIVMQIDERYGPVGHSDSNWKQLLDAGFNDSDVLCHPMLIGHDVIETTSNYEQLLNETIENNTYVIGLFGIGADGHTAGILPNSPAITAAAEVAFYQGPDYPRITITPAFFAKIHTAIVYAMGNAKLQALQNLQKDLPPVLEPAQLLKQIPDTWIYTDQMGENA